MKIDLLTRKLYTDSGKFLKKLHCPKKVRNSDLETQNGKLNCSVCSQAILDTDGMSDPDLLEVLNNKPRQCVKIDLNQSNLKIL